MSGITVIKYGGNAVSNKDLRNKILKDIVVLAKKKPVILVHGAGPQISEMMKQAALNPKFINGLRYTDEKTLAIVQKALLDVNKTLTSHINSIGGCAFGISGRKANSIIAKRMEKLGLVGDVKTVRPKLIELFLDVKIVPVIMPLCSDGKCGVLNVNADDVATEIAVAFKAENLVFLTDVPGVLDSNKQIIPEIKSSQIKSLINKNIISGGMVPKTRGCFEAIRRGVKSVIITDGSKGLIGSGTVFMK